MVEQRSWQTVPVWCSSWNGDGRGQGGREGGYVQQHSENKGCALCETIEASVGGRLFSLETVSATPVNHMGVLLGHVDYRCAPRAIGDPNTMVFLEPVYPSIPATLACIAAMEGGQCWTRRAASSISSWHHHGHVDRNQADAASQLPHTRAHLKSLISYQVATAFTAVARRKGRRGYPCVAHPQR